MICSKEKSIFRMKKKECYSQATFHANISRLIVAKTKKQAIEKATYELNKTNIRLDQITLENEIGESKVFSVHQVEEIDWYDVEFTECSNQFRVFGRIRLFIFLLQTDIGINEIEHAVYNLPRTLVYEKPVLVISEGFNHIFLTVLQQKMEWKTILKEIIPLSKLA